MTTRPDVHPQEPVTARLARLRAAKAVLESPTATPEQKAEARAVVLAMKNARPSEENTEYLLTHIEQMLGNNPTAEQIEVGEQLLGIIAEVCARCAYESQASKAAALLGSITSARKAAASRANGAKGGRPRINPGPVTITINRPAKPAPMFDELNQIEEGGE